LLAGLSGLAGLLIASWTTRVLLGFLPTSDVPVMISGAIDHRALAFTFVLSLATGLVFGLAPALQSTRPQLAPTLKDQVGAVTGTRGSVRVRKALVVGQVAISMLLLVGAGLFIRSLRHLQLLDLGLNPAQLIAFNINPTLSGYTPVRTKRFNQEIMQRVSSVPGVAGVAVAQVGLLEGNEWDSSITIDGYDAKPGESMNPYFNAVSPGYFKTMSMRVLAGRDFDDRDARYEAVDPGAPGFPPPYTVAIVNQSFATHYFGDRNAIGRHLGFGGNPGTKTPIEIVGVVSDAKYTGVRDDVPRQVFVPFLQNDFAGGSVVYVRTTGDPNAVFGSVRQIARQIDANVPLYNLRTLDHQIDQSLLNDRLMATLSTAFSVLATLLAVIGLYGVMAYTVARRTREIGIRMALGAVTNDVVWLVMRDVVTLAGAGIVLGLIAALGSGRFLRAQLSGIVAADPLAIAVAAATLGTVALVAGYIPARRATRVNPVRALKQE
jgi:predicted permease